MPKLAERRAGMGGEGGSIYGTGRWESGEELHDPGADTDTSNSTHRRDTLCLPRDAGIKGEGSQSGWAVVCLYLACP